MNAGYTIVKFRDEAMRDMVLEDGVVHFDRKPVILRPWSIDLDTMRLVKFVPVWVRLPSLGLQYWAVKCLSALISTIGKPMLVDNVTKDRSMVKFARVLVDVEISDNLPKTISFLNERGQLVEQILEYEWLPTQCSFCKVLGHTATNCKRDQRVVWRKKEVMKGPMNSEEVIVLTSAEPTTDSFPKENAGVTTIVDTQKIVPMEGCNILSWNVRGLNKRNKQRSLLYFCRLNKVGLGAFLETKLRGNKVEEMMKNVFVGWDCYNGQAIEDRILLVWQSGLVFVTVLQESAQFVHCRVKILGKAQEFCLTFVYGRNTIEERKDLWQALALLVFPVQPWLLAGDFNAAFDYDDRIGRRVITDLEMEDAQQWRALCMADELRSVGSHYTWSNK
ncbi:uncharacterized protein LOC133824008 [Humulus lupulus]|uniref:uncharacterized protein LOC133824008 n=1 Tax=Humulus lupulus TaxID=3486 RepID=UPI002B411C47|nr:uncharacterized protein LOC133824008 [Humulus lupulus]